VWVRDHPIPAGLAIGLGITLFTVLFFLSLPIIPLPRDNLREFYHAILDFNGVLFGFAGVIGIFGIENLRRRDLDYSDTLYLMAAIILSLLVSTFLSLRGLLSLPDFEPGVLVFAFSLSTISAVFSALFLPILSLVTEG